MFNVFCLGFPQASLGVGRFYFGFHMLFTCCLVVVYYTFLVTSHGGGILTCFSRLYEFP